MELPMVYLLSILVPIFFFFFMLISIITKQKAIRRPVLPSPWSLPVVGSIHYLRLVLAKNLLPFRAFRDLSVRYGPLMLLRVGPTDITVASSREAAEAILKTHNTNFSFRSELVAAKVILYNCTDMIFSPHGPHWKQLRKLCFINLLGPKPIRSSASIRTQESHNLIRVIQTYCSSTTVPIDLSEKIYAASTAILTRSAFGARIDNPERFNALAKEALELLGGLCIVDMVASWTGIQLLSGVKFKLRRLHHQIDAIAEEIVKQHELKAMRSDGPTDDNEVMVDLVDSMLNLQHKPESENVAMARDSIKGLILDMFLGGTTTTSDTIEWAMTELIRNPEAMEKAQKEVRNLYKDKNQVTEEDAMELGYLKLVIKETLRLHPPAPLIPRICKETCEMLGYEIKAGSRVFLNVWAINRDPLYWEEAERFNPERFIKNSDIDFKGSNFEYLPFGGGRRLCPGMGFGLATLHLILAHLLLYFDWKMPHGMKANEIDMSETPGLIASKKHKLMLTATLHGEIYSI
ncbi:germacrene A hydroxylase-like [Curcuma longa]|uniref:germacrene A hydroxylase-like n=1 Tax=Curcuma longa TaxID=136217 RepID=UPI003D9DC069